MRFLGFQIPAFRYPGVPDAALFDRVAAIARAAEDGGFDAVFVMDHFEQIPTVGPRDDPILEAYTLLGALAARTSRVRLGTLVAGVTYRNPALLAKMVTTLDVVSSGRAILGIGAGWNEPEHRAYGYRFPPIGERETMLEDALRICRAMFRKSPATIEGKLLRVEGALDVPRPIQPDGPPILVGGAGERRTLRLVARYADVWNMIGGDAEMVRHKVAVLRRHCDEVGRDPAAIVKTRLGALLIAPTRAEAERKMAAYAARRQTEPERLRGYVVSGDPSEVRERCAALLDAGLDGLVFNMPDAYDLAPVELAAKALEPLRARSVVA